MTRGTTHTQRMRRVDRWLLDTRASLLRHGSPLIVDLGFGASPATPVELFERARALNPRAQLLGLEIEPERVASAQAAVSRDGLSFALGGFEVPAPRPPSVIRAFNVLRQYKEEDVEAIWARLRGPLALGGIVVEGTCDELGRRAAWVTLDRRGPHTLTLATRLAGLERPSELAERLPKALIHHHVPGEAIHAFLAAADAAWAEAAVVAPFGLKQRWRRMAAHLKAEGWPLVDDDHRWRLGELSVDYAAIAPWPAGARPLAQ